MTDNGIPRDTNPNLSSGGYKTRYRADGTVFKSYTHSLRTLALLLGEYETHQAWSKFIPEITSGDPDADTSPQGIAERQKSSY